MKSWASSLFLAPFSKDPVWTKGVSTQGSQGDEGAQNEFKIFDGENGIFSKFFSLRKRAFLAVGLNALDGEVLGFVEKEYPN